MEPITVKNMDSDMSKSMEKMSNKSKSKSWKGMVLPSLFLIVVGILLLYQVPCLVLSTNQADNFSEKILRALPLNKEDHFSIRFRHSVNKGLVVETYGIDKVSGEIFLDYGLFESYGAGMLDTLTGQEVLTEQGNMLRVDFSRQMLAGVDYAAAGIAGHELIYGKERLALFQEQPYRTIHISIRRLPLWKLYYSKISILWNLEQSFGGALRYASASNPPKNHFKFQYCRLFNLRFISRSNETNVVCVYCRGDTGALFTT